ncbi:MAG TPA: hypothetical protein VGE52_22125, partial [Pirellulales bacterium]
MPRKYELTWASRGDGSGRWQKFYKGKIYRFGGTHRSDVEDYKRALAEWVQLRAQLDSQVVPSPVQVEYSAAIKEWGDVITWAVVNGDEAIAARAREKLAELQDRAELPSPPPLGPTDRFGPLQPPTPRPIPTGPLGREPGPEPLQVVGPIEWATPERLDRVIWTDRLEVQNRKKTPPGEDVAGRVEDYLKIRRRDVDLGKLSAGRYDPIRVHLQAFRDWIGPATSVKAISAKVVQDFHGHLSTAIFEKKISGIYAKDRFNEFRTFVKWLWQSELIDALPRNLDASNLRISKGPVEVETMKIAEVNRLLAEARDRTKLYLLLMLNCGMTQVDVADLKQAEVDLARGTVTRKRSKTSHHEGVPTVTYRLWPETLRL